MPDVFVAPEKMQEELVSNEAQQPVGTGGSSFASIPLELNHATFFSTYCKNPENISFGIQEPSEKILLFLRRDFITNVPWILSSLLLALGPTLFGVLGGLTNMQMIPISFNFSFILLSFYYLLVLTYIFINFITWYFNISLITTIRVMDVDFESLIYKKISETKLTLVQDISYNQIGAIQTFYDYGTVLIQTAAAVNSFEFTAIPQPQKVVEIVEDLIGKGIKNNGT